MKLFKITRILERQEPRAKALKAPSVTEFPSVRVKPPPPPMTDGEKQRTRKWSRIFSAAFLVTPTLIGAIYLYGFSSDMYETDSVFMVKSSASGAAAAASILGLLAGNASLSAATPESYAIVRYVESREIVRKLDDALHLRRHFTDTGIDFFSRLSGRADFEDYYNYLMKKVSISFDSVSGEILLSCRAFSPQVASDMAALLTSLSEELVNQFNVRSQHDTLLFAQQQVEVAEGNLRAIESDLTKFRIQHQSFDPEASIKTVIDIISGLQGQAVQTEADIKGLTQISGAELPQLASLRNKLKAVQAQINEEQQKLTGPNAAIGTMVEDYNLLLVREDIARKAYDTTLGSLAAAIAEAGRQKLYVVGIVPSHPPEVATLPNRPQSLLFIFAGTVIVWIVIRMALAALRDHLV